MRIAIVTGSGGLIGSESVRYFAEQGFDVIGIENDMRARFFGPTASTTPTTERLAARCPTRSAALELDIRDARRRRARCSPQHARDDRAGRPHRRAALARLGGVATRTPTSRVNANGTLNLLAGRARHTARTRRSSSPRPTRSTATARTSCRCVELETRLELPEDHRWYGGIDTDDVDRPLHALAVRRLEGGGRPAGAGVRALLRHADGLLPRRLPDRARSTPAPSCTASSPT